MPRCIRSGTIRPSSATTDVFVPIADESLDCGAIAATTAMSDVHAMGGRSLSALALVAMPIDKLPFEMGRCSWFSGSAGSRSAVS